MNESIRAAMNYQNKLEGLAQRLERNPGELRDYIRRKEAATTPSVTEPQNNGNVPSQEDLPNG